MSRFRPHRPPGSELPRRPPPRAPARRCLTAARLLELLHKLLTGGAALAMLVRLLL